MEGIVVDRQTKLPVVNATISLASIVGHGNSTNDLSVWQTNEIVMTNANASGVFVITPIRKWGIYIVPMDVFPRKFEVTINRTNFETTKIYFLHKPMTTGRNAITKLGNIQLNPEK